MSFFRYPIVATVFFAWLSFVISLPAVSSLQLFLAESSCECCTSSHQMCGRCDKNGGHQHAGGHEHAHHGEVATSDDTQGPVWDVLPCDLGDQPSVVSLLLEPFLLKGLFAFRDQSFATCELFLFVQAFHTWCGVLEPPPPNVFSV